MSHAYGEIIKDGKTVAHFEYNGTVDLVQPILYATAQEVSDNWRKGSPREECKCPEQGEDVLIYTNYGYGYYWPGKACLKCMMVTDGIDPYECERKEGHPVNGLYPRK